MVAVAVRFPAGRYHATPWGRHVNEADVAWPPEPWRLLRALVAAWHRKADRERFPEPVLAGLIDALAERPPLYGLPNAVHAHSRHYMPTREGARETKVLVFDAFCRVDADDPLIIAWPGLVLPDDQAALLDHLLARLGYLGRAESWACAERIDDVDEDRLNCRPHDADDAASAEGADEEMPPTRTDVTPVSLLVPLAPADYARRRTALVADNKALRKGKEARLVAATLPERLLDALTLDTGDYQAAGWNRPPAAKPMLYFRPALNHTAPRRAGWRPRTDAPTTARFVLAGKPLPRIEDSVRIGELARRALMAQAGRIAGRDNIPMLLSGRGPDLKPLRDPTHDHAFFLPEDADGDGFIDHLIVYAAGGLDNTTVAALDRLVRLRIEREAARFATMEEEEDGNPAVDRSVDRSVEWRLALEAIGPLTMFTDRTGGFNPSDLLRPSRVWQSATPYLHPWFAKPVFQAPHQIIRECERRGLPRPIEEPQRITMLCIKGRDRRPIHFHRFRSRRGLTQPDTLGSFWRLTFSEPIHGPLALGFGCHYGLGLFKAAD